MKPSNDTSFFGHRGPKNAIFTEMWERMSYYGMRALLVLFMTASLQTQGLALLLQPLEQLRPIHRCGIFPVYRADG